MSSIAKSFIHWLPIRRISLHLLFWAFLSGMYIISYNRLDKDTGWVFVLKDLVAVTTIFYCTSYIAIPKWLMKGKYVICFIWLMAIYLWWAILTYYTCYLISEYMAPSERLAMYTDMVLENGLKGLFNFGKIPFYLLDFIYLVSLPLGVKITQAFLNSKNQQTKLEMKNMELALNNVELELAFLKSQINPHFLFNTLNNIYILVLYNNPKGAESLTQLSSLMSYLLYESNRPTVPLKIEYIFLKNYIDLERLRINENVNISIQIETDYEDYLIVPLIIFPFVENAFKHGPRSSSKNAWVDINITTNSGKLRMIVSNAFTKVPKPHGYVGGIGIENVQKRLALNYPSAYNLIINEGEGQYKVDLTIDLLVHNNSDDSIRRYI